MFGWYSEKQAELIGKLKYETPDGSFVIVTEVSQGREYPSKWDDVIFVGEVVQYREHITRGKMNEDKVFVKVVF